MTLMKFGFLAALALVSTGVQASELDGVNKKVPQLVLSEINTDKGTVSKFAVQADDSISPEALKGLTDMERQARIDAFVKKTVRPENKISEERVEKVSSELDGQGSTSACWWRWRGGYYGGGYYGGGCYYRPAWNYGYYGYGAGYYGVGYYGGGYYGGYYGRGYYGNGCYYTMYSTGYYGW